ncbi:unknown [Collinsella sp. CAG:289]|nr:unknown [Collinsella sp. CAG:289]
MVLGVLDNLSVGRSGLNICILSRSNLGLNLSLLDHIHRLVQFHVLVLGHVSPPAL